GLRRVGQCDAPGGQQARQFGFEVPGRLPGTVVARGARLDVADDGPAVALLVGGPGAVPAQHVDVDGPVAVEVTEQGRRLPQAQPARHQLGDQRLLVRDPPQRDFALGFQLDLPAAVAFDRRLQLRDAPEVQAEVAGPARAGVAGA